MTRIVAGIVRMWRGGMPATANTEQNVARRGTGHSQHRTERGAAGRRPQLWLILVAGGWFAFCGF
jgi:hypothetical protein